MVALRAATNVVSEGYNADAKKQSCRGTLKSLHRPVPVPSAQSDTLQATTALANASLDKSRAQGAYAKAQSLLVNVLGVAANTRLDLAEELVDPGATNN